MEEQKILFETAKLLHSIDENLSARFYYTDMSKKFKVKYYPMLTQSLSQRWLREEHGLNVIVSSCGWNKKDKHFSFRCNVKLITKDSNMLLDEAISDIKGDGFIFRSYESALEKGLQSALKQLKEYNAL